MKIPLPISMLSVTFAIIWVGMCPILNPWLIDGMMFHPDQQVDSTRLSIIDGIHGQEITFGNQLTAWLYQNPTSKYIVLFSHGNAGNLSHRVEKIAQILKGGQSVFIWDYPGFGRSKGLATLKNIGSDGLSAYDYLIASHYGPDQIILYGESLGCGINAEISEHRKVKGVIIDSGFTSLEAIAKERCPIFLLYPEFLLPPSSMNVSRALRDLPCLIIHGKKDDTIPFHHSEELHRAASRSTLLSLPNSSHNVIAPQDADSVQSAMEKFFAQI